MCDVSDSVGEHLSRFALDFVGISPREPGDDGRWSLQCDDRRWQKSCDVRSVKLPARDFIRCVETTLDLIYARGVPGS